MYLLDNDVKLSDLELISNVLSKDTIIKCYFIFQAQGLEEPDGK